jgi:hypothetical protein
VICCAGEEGYRNTSLHHSVEIGTLEVKGCVNLEIQKRKQLITLKVVDEGKSEEAPE